MKNYLVILVTIGIGVAYWYQIPEPPKEPVPVVVATPVPKRVFVATSGALDRPAYAASGERPSTSVLLGNDKPSHLHP